ncbi:hypothetical protein [Rhizobium paknamense]|uniref:Chromosome segregation ATPase n=1 Tax=Rhizobium paknamense TaxID=1206817 RepID=A0ABU0IFU6_9HYPH|nr:hypothetical protein [Rhizobium paknamense]MDQ0457113.1 chromosome segregation ATPase [Rhizobium paknamense]
MIEYALLFALGFFAAVLLVALISPAIHRRVVLYTENRLRATAPLGADEVRAQKDMVRAVYAAENARLAHELKRERDYQVALKVTADQADAEMRRALANENVLKEQIGAMSKEAGQLRAELREAARHAEQMKAVLERSESSIAARDLEIEALTQRLSAAEEEKQQLKRSLASRDTQIEDFRLRVTAMRDERDKQRDETQAAVSRAQKAEQRLLQEEDRRLRLEERLEKLNATPGGTKKETVMAGMPPAKTSPEKEIAALTEEVRLQNLALIERLQKAKTADGDEALRAEIADIAAKMVVITARQEGEEGPLQPLVAKAADQGDSEVMKRLKRLAPDLFKPQPEM